MTKITAVIRSEKLKAVEKALREVGAPGFTYYNVRGHGRETVEKPVVFGMPGAEMTPIFLVADILPRVKIEIICSDEARATIVHAIRHASMSGQQGDGIIYTEDLGSITRILTGEEGQSAL